MMRSLLFLTILGFPLLALPKVAAQDFSFLRQGMNYQKAHDLLLENGWQMIGQPMTCRGNNHADVQNAVCEAGFYNVVGCSGNGYCSYNWKNAYGQKLQTTSFGGHSSYDGTLIGWTID